MTPVEFQRGGVFLMFCTPTGWEILLKNEAKNKFEELGSDHYLMRFLSSKQQKNNNQNQKALNPNQNQKFC
jgi:hypothetical protein